MQYINKTNENGLHFYLIKNIIGHIRYKLQFGLPLIPNLYKPSSALDRTSVF